MKQAKQKSDNRKGRGHAPTASTVRAIAGLPAVRRGLIVFACVFLTAMCGWGLTKFMDRSSMESASGAISTSVNSTRRLYGSIADVGGGSVMVSLVLAQQYSERNVSIKWLEGGGLSVKNKYGGKLDVVALHNHFELHFYGVPRNLCPGLVALYAYEKTGMPVWVNTVPVHYPSAHGSAEAACSAQVNNLVWKFR